MTTTKGHPMSNDALRMAFWKRWFDMVHAQPLLGPMFDEAISAMKSLEADRTPSDAGLREAVERILTDCKVAIEENDPWMSAVAIDRILRAALTTPTPTPGAPK